MKKEDVKEIIKELMETKEETENLLREVVYNYAIEKGLSRAITMECFPYKKIIREEFDLVI